MDALKDHMITNAAGGKTICVKKHNFPDTGCRKSLYSLQRGSYDVVCITCSYLEPLEGKGDWNE